MTYIATLFKPVLFAFFRATVHDSSLSYLFHRIADIIVNIIADIIVDFSSM